MVIRRVPLRDQVYRAVLARLLSGELSPGARLSDSALADELGVSRTPVRETLMRLEKEGFLDAAVGRGFFVKPLSPTELREVFPVFWTLEALAVRQTVPFPPAALRELDEVNRAAEASVGDPEKSVELGLRWHQVLREACPNEHLRDLLASHMRITRRYGVAYWRDTGHLQTSVAAHDEVADFLRAGDTDGAVGRLEDGWRAAMEQLAGWLERRGEPAAEAAAAR